MNINSQQNKNKPAQQRKQRKRKNLKKKKKSRTQRSKLSLQVHLSQCARLYAKVQTNPFGSFVELPCLPDSNTHPSFKTMARARGVFTTGTAGIGWVVFNPWTMAWNNNGLGSTWSDYPVLQTGPTFAGTSYDWTVASAALTTGVTGSNSNTAFSTTDYGAGNWQYRLVGAGLSASYIGTDFRNQGRMILYRDQHSDSIPKGVDATSSYFLSDNYAISLPVQRKPHYITAPPTEYDLFSYRQPSDFSLSAALNRYVMLIYIDGGDTDVPQAWEWEAIAYFEILGRSLPLTSSPSDGAGMNAVHSSLSNKASRNIPQVDERNLLSKVGEILQKTSTYVLPIAGSLLRTALAGNYPLLPPVPSVPSIMEVDD